MFRHSWTTLTENGNIASAVVLDGLRRLFEEGTTLPGATGVVAGFGPGITAEMAVGSWVLDTPRNMEAGPPASSAAYLEQDFAQIIGR
jgi:1,3,6,8-tetrahydroxynaphthalene synthase